MSYLFGGEFPSRQFQQMEQKMEESVDGARPEETPRAADFAAPPPVPPAPLKLYNAERNREFGIVTMEEIHAEFQGNQETLAARIRRDKAGRLKKTWKNAVDLASDGVRLQVLKESLKGTGRSTELMASKTGISAPTSQTRIHYGQFLPWAAARLQLMMDQSTVEKKTGEGVADFVMPSDQSVIEMGQEEAKKAGCWGLPQIIMIAGADPRVVVADLPRNIGWKVLKSPYPWWDDLGPLDRPWEDFHIFAERRDPSQQQEPQPTWSLGALFAKDGGPVVMSQRAFVARCADGVLLSAADALNEFKPHVKFLAQKTNDAAVVDDETGKQCPTLDDIAIKLSMSRGTLTERLRGSDFLNHNGEATPAALDAGITTIVNGGTQFCFDSIKNFLDMPVEEGRANHNGDRNEPAREVGRAEATAQITAAANPVADAPKAEADQAEATLEIAAGSEAQETENATDRAPRVTTLRGSGKQATGEPVARRNEGDASRTEPLRNEMSSESGDVASVGRQAVKRLEDGIEALLAAESLIGRRAQDGQFVALSGDAMTLRNRISTAAQATTAVVAELKDAVRVCKTFLKNIDEAAVRVRELESETVELTRRVREQQAVIDKFERGSYGHAEVIQFRNAPDTDVKDGSATVAQH